jgi:soluble lytic murein transglycosylase-like protein
MKPKRARVPSAALATTLFLALSSQAIPSLPAIRDTLTPPAAKRAPGRTQLAAILGGGSERWLSPAPVSHTDLNAALGAQQRRFGLFRDDSAVEVDARSDLLRRLPFGAILAAAGERNHVDSLLLAAVVETESRFAPRAVSPCGAVGLMQLLPSTGHDYGAKDLQDPVVNINVGSRYLRRLLDRFKGRSDLALAAYNTGPEVIARYGCVPPYRETQDFVRRVLTRYDQHRLELARVSAHRPMQIRIAAAGLAGPSHHEPAQRRSEAEGLAR